ncbi:MAG: NAD-dependent epimerase/dehydratase family protein, partial [Phycisphaerales bacterium]
SKLMGEYMAELAQKEGLLRVGITRFHNVFGPRCDTDPRTSQVIPSLIRKVIENDSGQLVVWGSGRQRRAFLFVDDAVETLVRVRERAMGEGPVQMGLERSTGIGELAETIVEVSGRPIEIVFDTSKPEGDFDRRPDLAKAERVLGFTPRVSLRDGLERTFRWIQSEGARGAVSGRPQEGAAA